MRHATPWEPKTRYTTSRNAATLLAEMATAYAAGGDFTPDQLHELANCCAFVKWAAREEAAILRRKAGLPPVDHAERAQRIARVAAAIREPIDATEAA